MKRRITFIVICLAIFYGQKLYCENVDRICCEDLEPDDRMIYLHEALSDIECAIWLNLSHQDTKLTSVPQEVCNLINLKCLDVSYNRISSFPAGFVNLQKLQCLDLSGNHYLHQLPAFFNNMPNLKIVKLEELNWTESRKEKLKQDFPHIEFIF